MASKALTLEREVAQQEVASAGVGLLPLKVAAERLGLTSNGLRKRLDRYAPKLPAGVRLKWGKAILVRFDRLLAWLEKGGGSK